ncbi:putative phage replisome organizer [Enterococcus sp. PF1-24]|uniref:phage replisome organizer N-terminal domain-containing protein n=1 Tax=unclassified Enterococcus TaxID=2608891 RepID=UPI00247375E6|nr:MULTISPECIES: phage replisome organizer N-terminal domain-containing protein [unclassified Enterococcus]MDH6364699.1 putative phage replisome organizer [Enterococcus sp. PFB1-1]MDH6401825.1 putative phage replisome organizer [Enterococcus sp. PF1-24]
MSFKNNTKAKRYFWLKLKTDFFDQKEIKLLRRIAGGDTYTIIYLKMLLRSLKNDGKLFYEAMGDNFAEEIALDINENPEDVSLTISYLESKGLLELIENDEYFLNKVPEMVGSESYSAERVRDYRAKKKLQSNTKALHGNSDVISCNEEIELELEIDIELEKEIDNKPSKKVLTERFENLWKEYPNKQGKAKAFTAYQKAIKDGVTDEEISKGIKAYKKELALKQTEQKFIAHGSTWFNQRRWEDEHESEPIRIEQDYSLPEEYQNTLDDLPEIDESQIIY